MGRSRRWSTRAGNVEATYGYDAYGGADPQLSSGDTDPLLQLNAYRYTGKRTDVGSETIDMGARRFSSDSARFLQPDVYQGALSNLGLSMDPLTGNRYALAAGNPISYVEVDGHALARSGSGGKSVPIVGEQTEGSSGHFQAVEAREIADYEQENYDEVGARRRRAQRRRHLGPPIGEPCEGACAVMTGTISTTCSVYESVCDSAVEGNEAGIAKHSAIAFAPVGVGINLLRRGLAAYRTWRATRGISRGGEYLFETWHLGTFPNRVQSIQYHLGKHGAGRTAAQYTEDAMRFFDEYSHLGKPVTLKDGTPGIRIQTKIPDPAGGFRTVGGYGPTPESW